LATQACNALIRPAQVLSQENAESNGQIGLNLLDQRRAMCELHLSHVHDVIPICSVHRLKKIGSLTDWEELELNQEIQKLLDGYFTG
jgi:hypothetical protein